ncbi:hypothetical protein FO519_005191 [Halicephalobus sp. NKZ332]|nr:hypothetical protein FO519_005191 [Halicephalobus sp. NKZ332]
MMDTSFNAFGAQGGWGGDSSFTTQAPAQGGQQNANNEYANFRLPVTISTLQRISPGEELLTIGNYKFGHVRLIGVVKEADLSDPSSATYKIADINGDPDVTFSVVHYLSLDGATDSQIFVEGTNVFVFGRIRAFDSVSSIIALQIRAVDEQSEIECFPKEARVAELFFSKDIPNRLPELGDYFSGTMLSPDPPASNNRQMQGPGTPTFRQNPTNAAQKPYGVMQGKFANDQVQNDQQNKIYMHIKTVETEEGVHVKNIRLAIGGDANFQSDLDYLTANGLLYNTLDDDHYAVVP